MNRTQLKLLAVPALAGVGLLVTWRLLRYQRIPMVESELDLEQTTPSPHLLDSRVFGGERPPQFIDDGVGPLFYRRYYADIRRPQMNKTALMQAIIGNINRFSPPEMMHFERRKGEDGLLNIGDEFYIHIASPWNGPVHVIDVTPTSFSFITLEQHFEAGEIQFHLLDHPDLEDAIRFEIRSWSRSRRRIVDFLYTVVPIMRAAQRSAWVYFCQRVVEESGGELIGQVNVATHRIPYHRNQTKQTAPVWKQYAPDIERYRSLPINYDLDRREEYTEISGWRIDEYATELPDEPPGEPVVNGSFEQAKRVLLNYEFPDPDLITGIFIPDDPLEDRVMVLRARWLIFSFLFGVRIGQVYDDERNDPNMGQARVWGYSYRTLEGHFEMGEITFEIWKFFETGRVEFRIHAYSKTGLIRNPFYRIGFRLFGRGLQRRFGRTALERMQQIVIDRLSGAAHEVERTEVQTTAEDEEAQQKADETRDADQAGAD